MRNLESVKAYLQSDEFREAARECRRQPQPFITISREAGAGGSSLAVAIVGEMRRLGYPALQGWRVWDKELCEIVAQDLNLTVLLDDLEREVFRTGLADYLAQIVADNPPQALITRKTIQAIRMIAAAGRAVFVGRAAACATAGLSGGIHLRLVAPRPLRVDRLMGRYGLDRAAAVKRLTELDGDRRAFVKAFFQKDIDDPLLYGSVWNTAKTGIEEIADAVVRLTLNAAGRTVANEKA